MRFAWRHYLVAAGVVALGVGSARASLIPEPPPLPQSQALTPEEVQALDRAVAEALEADRLPDSSVAHISERIKRWSFVMVRAPQGSNDFKLAQRAMARAQQDLKFARSQALQGGQLDDATRQVLAAKLDAARKALDAGKWAVAQQELDYVLDQSPNYPVALSLSEELRRKKRGADAKRLILVTLLGTVIAVGAGTGFVRIRRRAPRAEGPKESTAPIGQRRAVIRVVDGVGIGKSVTIEPDRALVRIGAAVGQTPVEINDLVISDARALVSRFHCVLVREGDQLFLIDSSTNGTSVNGRSLARGERVPLATGDRISVSDVSRLEFQYL